MRHSFGETYNSHELDVYWTLDLPKRAILAAVLAL